MKAWILALLLVGAAWAQSEVVSPSDGIGYFFKDFVRGFHILVVDLTGTQAEKVQARVRLEQDYQVEMAREQARGASTVGIQLRIAQVRSQKAAIQVLQERAPENSGIQNALGNLQDSVFNRATAESATRACREKLDPNCVCTLTSDSLLEKSFSCTNGLISGEGVCDKETGICTASALGQKQQFNLTDYVQ